MLKLQTKLENVKASLCQHSESHHLHYIQNKILVFSSAVGANR